MRIKRTAASSADIGRILNYYVDRDPAFASKLAESLERGLKQLSSFPHSGSSREYLMPGLRALSRLDHIIFYIVRSDHILVLRVLHSRQDVAERLFEEP